MSVQVVGIFFLVWESILVLEESERSCDSSYCALMLTSPIQDFNPYYLSRYIFHIPFCI